MYKIEIYLDARRIEEIKRAGFQYEVMIRDCPWHPGEHLSHVHNPDGMIPVLITANSDSQTILDED